MSPDTMRKLAKPMLLAAALIWGTTYVVQKSVLDTMPPLYMVAFRFTLATVVLALGAWKSWKRFTPDYIWRGGITGGILFLVYALQTYGLQFTTPSKSAFLTATSCVMVPFLAWALLKQRPDRYNILAAVLCVAGIGLVSLNEQFSIELGDLLTVVGSVALAGSLLALVMLSKGKDVILLTVFQFLFTALGCWIAALFMEDFPSQALCDPAAVALVAYLGIFCTAIAMLLQNIGAVWSDPSSAAIILSLESVSGVIFSVLLYGDPVTPRLLAGFALIFVAILCSETKFSFLRKKPQDTMLDI